MSEMDFAGKTPEELEQLMEAEADPQPPVEQETVEPEASAEPPAPEPEVPAEPEPEKAEEPTVDQIEKDILLNKLELLEDEKRKAEAVAGRHGGELGFLRQKVRELEQRLGRPEGEEQPFVSEPEPQQRPPSRDKIAAYLVAQAVPQTVSKFESENPDAVELAPTMVEYLKRNGFDMQAIMSLDDPLEATRETERVLSEAYYHARSERKARVIAELTTKKAEQFARSQEAKKKAAVSGSGGSAPAPVREKAIEDMTVEELDAKMRELNPVY